MKTLRWLALAALVAGGAALVPSAGADGEQTVPFTCEETTEPDSPVPDELSAPLPITTSDSLDPVKVFQPVTWTARLGLPELDPPDDFGAVNFRFFRVELAIPDGVGVTSVSLVAPPGEVLNPPRADMAVTVSADDIVIDLPAVQTPQKRFRIEQGETEITYPADALDPENDGTPVVLPQIRVQGVALPSAAGETISWLPPVVDTQINFFAAIYHCDADVPDTSVLNTVVTTARQQCDGRNVTVQVGFNTPTAGPNVIQGTAAADTVNGLGGADRFCGLAGVDRFNGGSGNDRAVGGLGNDVLRGDAGNDRLQGDAGNDNLQGGANNDALIGGTQRDTCNGGPQRDTATTCEVRQSIP